MFNIESQFLFPKQLIISDDSNYPQYRNQLIECCYEQMSNDKVGAQYTNRGGWQSNAHSMMNDSKFSFFIEILSQNIGECLKQEYQIIQNTTIDIPRIWINISGHNHYNTTHTHPMSHYTGVFYVKCPENCGNIIFNNGYNANDYQECLYRENEVMENNKIYPSCSYTPVEGRLILFPSCVPHLVEMNQSDSDRISISFDLLFR